MKKNRVHFSFYGVGVCVESDEDEMLKAITHDFSYFVAATDQCAVQLAYYHCDPDYNNLPVVTASAATPRNITFNGKETAYIDYFGKGLNIYNKKENSCKIYTKDKDLAHEILYLSILSRVSEELEKKRIHRIHALGIEYKGQGVLVMLPSGGGKTTLAMSILGSSDTDIHLLSEDSPLLTHQGMLLPFPLRIGTIPSETTSNIDDRFIRTVKRMEHGPKITIDINYFSDRISHTETPAGFVLLGIRSTGEVPSITRASKFKMIKHCLMNSVVGVGLYQGMEFIMQKNFFELLGGIPIILSRMYNNFRLIARSKFYTFIIGRNVKRNYEVLYQFLKNNQNNL
ncbi:MAG TPA: hypothetical protein PLO78_03215 [Candidatus Omnitrophota bacterium]|nr:hypothetical protein [Candidatus Omnitrophota bacterium]